MRSQLVAQIEWLLTALQLPDDAPTTGNQPPECPSWRTWPPRPMISLVWVLWALYQLTQWVAYHSGVYSFPKVTGIFRCPPANKRRGGTPGSRHQFGAGEGKPYAAVDARFEGPQVAVLREYAHHLPDLVRRMTGWQQGVGIIIYGSGLLHLDLRERDYIDVN